MMGFTQYTLLSCISSRIHGIPWICLYGKQLVGVSAHLHQTLLMQLCEPWSDPLNTLCHGVYYYNSYNYSHGLGNTLTYFVKCAIICLEIKQNNYYGNAVSTIIEGKIGQTTHMNR